MGENCQGRRKGYSAYIAIVWKTKHKRAVTSGCGGGFKDIADLKSAGGQGSIVITRRNI